MKIHERSWDERPFDISNLLNPAFLGVILRKATDGYSKERSIGLPFELSFVIFPLVLHGETREKLPKTIATRLQPWLYDHREVLIQFPSRTRELVPFAKESLIFAMHRDVIAMKESGHLVAGGTKLKGLTALESKSNEVRSIVKKSEFVGRWLGTAGASATIFASFGIRP